MPRHEGASTLTPPDAVTKSREPVVGGRLTGPDADLFSLGNLIRLDETQALRRRIDGRNLRRLPWFLWAFAVVAAIEAIVSLTNSGWTAAGLACGNLALYVACASALTWPEPGRWPLARRVFLPARRVIAARATVTAGILLVLQLALVTGWVRLQAGSEGDNGWFAFFPWLVLGFRFRAPQALLVHTGLLAVSATEVLVCDLDPGLLIAASILNAMALGIGSLVNVRFRRDFFEHWRASVARGREQARMQEELETARAVQLSMLPRAAPEVPGLDIATAMVPATEVGGDYYDFFSRPDDGFAVVVGDVAGHGLGSGLVLSGVRSGLHLLMEGGEDLLETLERLDRMVQRTSHHRMRVSMLLVEILDGWELRIASAGHPPLLIRERQTGEIVEVDLPALPLGSRIGRAAYEEGRRVGPGDVLLLYTDGLFETTNPEEEPFGLARIRETLAAHDPSAGSEALRNALVEELREFRGDAPPEDDVTLVVLTVV